jgi:S1-C subfamily serine protease
MGIISAVSGREWHTWSGGRIDNYVRLDLTLFPGSSGGAVVDTSGRVIGIATSGLSRIAGVAIPSSTVDRVAGELLARGYIRKGYLGVALQPVALPDHLIQKLDLGAKGGLIVLSVEPESGAARGGLLLGDILIALGDKPVADTDDVQGVLNALEAGKSLAATVVRGGERAQLTLTVGEWPRRSRS